MRRSDAFNRIRVVRDELAAARFSLAHVLEVLHSDPKVLSASEVALRPSDLRDCAANLEITYVLRLFAEFEAVLRDYWTVARPRLRRRRTPMETILDRLADLRNVDAGTLLNAHAVREYRNRIVHDRLRTPRVAFQDCLSRLGFFLSYLPLEW